ncbi:hypothetical protein HELRODRAFT_161422 [Helobdella robusta]|uniref:Uncharacterized protein n=1 Tax=Helobdella robusta TaxID=6412 RepID=T1ERG5_HELRO|nr:hypothetical protein HELRODRAFT_161422 [Helobdella robusta]ESO02183.1 hypothetical protein HELRODRAFT_161422 [Helobdella robusta]
MAHNSVNDTNNVTSAHGYSNSKNILFVKNRSRYYHNNSKNHMNHSINNNSHSNHSNNNHSHINHSNNNYSNHSNNIHSNRSLSNHSNNNHSSYNTNNSGNTKCHRIIPQFMCPVTMHALMRRPPCFNIFQMHGTSMYININKSSIYAMP